MTHLIALGLMPVGYPLAGASPVVAVEGRFGDLAGLQALFFVAGA